MLDEDITVVTSDCIAKSSSTLYPVIDLKNHTDSDRTDIYKNYCVINRRIVINAARTCGDRCGQFGLDDRYVHTAPASGNCQSLRNNHRSHGARPAYYWYRLGRSVIIGRIVVTSGQWPVVNGQ